jgi:hypothetical protein
VAIVLAAASMATVAAPIFQDIALPNIEMLPQTGMVCAFVRRERAWFTASGLNIRNAQHDQLAMFEMKTSQCAAR